MTGFPTPPGVATGYHPIDLTEHRNNTAISPASDTRSGRFNVWGNSFPAEFLPPGGTSVAVAGVPFVFPPVGAGADNIRCDGQFVEVQAGHYDWLHLLTAAERRTEDLLWLHFDDASVDSEWLRVSDFWAAPGYFGEVRAYKTPIMHYPHHVQKRLPATLWSQRVPVTRRAALTGVRLPVNIAIHVFAVTLQAAPASASASASAMAGELR